MPYNPALIQQYYDNGKSNMGDVSDETDVVARFRIAEKRYALVFLRVHFVRLTGSGTTADMTINVDSNRGTPFDHKLFTWEAVGYDVDINHRIPEDQWGHWLFNVGDDLVLEWTNPDDGNIQWGAEIGLIPIE